MDKIIQAVIDFKDTFKYLSLNVDFVDKTTICIFQNSGVYYCFRSKGFDEEERPFVHFSELIIFITTLEMEVKSVWVLGHGGEQMVLKM